MCCNNICSTQTCTDKHNIKNVMYSTGKHSKYSVTPVAPYAFYTTFPLMYHPKCLMWSQTPPKQRPPTLPLVLILRRTLNSLAFLLSHQKFEQAGEKMLRNEQGLSISATWTRTRLQ